NLLWVFNANEIITNVDPYHIFYPGGDVVDILATDVYSNKFAQKDYNDLLAIANGKPIALGEVGNIPTLTVLRKQPCWTWFMYWHEPSTLQIVQKQVWETYTSREALTLNQLPWVKTSKPKTHYPILK